MRFEFPLSIVDVIVQAERRLPEPTEAQKKLMARERFERRSAAARLGWARRKAR